MAEGRDIATIGQFSPRHGYRSTGGWRIRERGGWGNCAHYATPTPKRLDQEASWSTEAKTTERLRGLCALLTAWPTFRDGSAAESRFNSHSSTTTEKGLIGSLVSQSAWQLTPSWIWLRIPEPNYGEMIGGYYDENTWDHSSAADPGGRHETQEKNLPQACSNSSGFCLQ